MFLDKRSRESSLKGAFGIALAFGTLLGSLAGASAAVSAKAPENTSAPTISGKAQVGSLLTAGTGSWQSPSPIDFSFQWRRCQADGGACYNITNATDRLYTPRPEDVNHTLRLAVGAANAKRVASATSQATALVTTEPAEAPLNTTPPTISGLVKPGQTLTAAPGTWKGPSPLQFKYRWRVCDPKGGDCAYRPAQTRTYTLAAGDIAHTLRVLVQATNETGLSSSLSAPSPVVANPAPTPTSSPTIAGTPRSGETLTAQVGSWAGNQPISYSFRWLRCDKRGESCDAIAGASSKTYRVGSADAGQTIRVTVTATNSHGSAQSTSAQTAVVRAASQPVPQNTSPPSLSGEPQQGKTLKGNRGEWRNNPSDFNYSWTRCDKNGGSCSTIGGAHAASYTLSSADVGHTIRFRVEARNAAGSSVADSAPSPLVSAAPAAPKMSSPPTLAGTAQAGKTLSGSRGVWANNPSDFNYSWLRCDKNGGSCSTIGGARAASYTLSSADVGHTIRFRVEARNAAGSSFASSVPTALIQAAPAAPQSISPPKISGTAQQGLVLTGDRGRWSNNPSGYNYFWLRCDKNGGNCSTIAGATGTTWRLTSASVGHTIRFRVEARNAGGSSVASSVPSPVIRPAAAPPPPPTPNGCPAGTGPINIGDLKPPARLLLDAQQANPSVVHRNSEQIVLRYHVSACGGRPVQGALIYVTAVPFNQLSIPPERATGRDGWAELSLRTLAGYPVSPRQQLIALFVRARKSGENLLGGVSTRRLFSLRVNLRG